MNLPPIGPPNDAPLPPRRAVETTPPDPAPWGLAGAVVVPTLSFAGQLILAMVLGAVAAFFLILLDPNLADDSEQLSRLVVLVTILPIALASSLLTLGLVYASVSMVCRRPFLESLRITRPGRLTPLFVLAGIAAAAISVTLAGLFPPDELEKEGGALTELARSGLLGRAIWLVLAVLIAPVIEEILFRGYAYLGARQRLGPLGAGVGVTILFVAMHLTETGFYWPALVGIGTVAVLLIMIIQIGGNLTHCIACHLGYNGALALISVLGG
jgi:membrane protease YdiL (CAAX protease family)